MATVLGISNGIHNSSAALVDDGQVVAAVEEERISRYKRDGRIPVGAVNTILKEHGGPTISRIAVSGVADWSLRRQLGSIATYVKGTLTNPASNGPDGDNPTHHRGRGSIASALRSPIADTAIDLIETARQPDRMLSSVATQLAVNSSIDMGEGELQDVMEYVDHHRAHASGAYFTSGFQEATVLTVDSAGDSLSSTVYHGSGNDLHRVAANSYTDSIGMLWSRLPTVFGFKGAKHAGKFMGLAAYADEPPAELRQEFADMVEVDGLQIKNHWARDRRRSSYEALVSDLRDRFGEYPAPAVARAFQDRTEEVISELVASAIAETGCGNVAVSGGVMANVKVNQRIYELSDVNSLWVQQAMNDSGLSLGSAYMVGSQEHDWTPRRLASMALGPSFDGETVSRAIERYEDEADFHVSSPLETRELANRAADHLTEGRVVCLFAGPMEYGPRALGQRSILYQPTDPDAIDWLNKRLDRTEFMPFAPVTLREEAEECYSDYHPNDCPAADYMTISLDCTDAMAERSPGVVHVDGTARPQIIDEETEEVYYRILRAYHERTGIPTLINTSFNMHGEPLVCTPKQALESWIRSNNEALILEDRILTQGVADER